MRTDAISVRACGGGGEDGGGGGQRGNTHWAQVSVRDAAHAAHSQSCTPRSQPLVAYVHTGYGHAKPVAQCVRTDCKARWPNG